MTWNGLACLHVKIRKPSNGCGFLSSGHKIFHHFMQNGHGSCRNISAAALVHRVLYCIPFTSTNLRWTISWHTSVIHHRTRLFISSSTAGSVGEVTFCHPWMIVKAQQHTVEIQIMQSWWTIISLFLPLLILSHFPSYFSLSSEEVNQKERVLGDESQSIATCSDWRSVQGAPMSTSKVRSAYFSLIISQTKVTVH